MDIKPRTSPLTHFPHEIMNTGFCFQIHNMSKLNLCCCSNSLELLSLQYNSYETKLFHNDMPNYEHYSKVKMCIWFWEDRILRLNYLHCFHVCFVFWCVSCSYFLINYICLHTVK